MNVLSDFYILQTLLKINKEWHTSYKNGFNIFNKIIYQ